MNNFDFYLNKAIKILLVINICIMLTILSFFFAPSAFADSSDFILPTVSDSSLINRQYIIDNGLFDSVANRYIIGYPLLTDNSVYTDSVYIFKLSNNQLYYCTPDQISLFTYYTTSSSYSQVSTSQQPSNYYSAYSLYCTTANFAWLSSDIVSSFDSIELALSAIRSFIDSSVSDLPNYNGLRIPTGHYARIEFQNNNGSLTLNTTMSIASNTFGTPWPNSSQQWLSTGISSAESINNSSMVDIVWSKAGKTSIFGTTYNASASLSGNNQYLWIYNPVQMNPIFITDGTYYPPNDVITITDLVNVKAVRLYSVTASIFGPASTSDSEYGDSYITSDGAIGWVNQNGDPYTPSNGGGNSQSTDSDSVIQQFRSILSDLVGRIESLLVAPVEYIQRIINAGSTFFAWLSGLWSWLPPAVSGILTSVLYIMAVVGALKLLWR